MTTLCIAMFRFSYVNASMFWHGHTTQGIWFFHSHIADKAHRTDHTDGGHNAAQFLLVELANQVSYTESSVPVFDLEPVLAGGTFFETRLVAPVNNGHTYSHSLRGPPALV